MLVPEMIAYAGLAGLPAQAGLYTLLASSRPTPFRDQPVRRRYGHATTLTKGRLDRRSLRARALHERWAVATLVLVLKSR